MNLPRSALKYGRTFFAYTKFQDSLFANKEMSLAGNRIIRSYRLLINSFCDIEEEILTERMFLHIIEDMQYGCMYASRRGGGKE